METPEIFKQYAIIKNQIKELSEKARLMEIEVIEEMGEFDEVKTGDGAFYLVARKKWKYPKTIEEMEKNVREAKKEAELMGKAKFLETKSLAFRAIQS
ncbi:MAG: hypothetical protein KKF54_06705 [Candidatus Omnitrophica bacterium]|nr:hypothetical protein [Candidatus Omnitrophota bacterium]